MTREPARVGRAPAGDSEGEEHWDYRSTAGRLMPLVQARLVNDAGEVVEWDGESTGELQVRGPWIARTSTRTRTRPEGRRRLAAHRRRRLDRPARLHPHLRPLQGRHQVRRRADLLGRPRERADGA